MPGSLIVTDDWSGYASLGKRGYDHHAIAESGDPEIAEEFMPMIHLVFSNLKTWLNGIHHGVSAKHLQAYLNEFTFRFNRRFYPFNAFLLAARHRPVSRRRPMPTFIPARGRTLHRAGVCVNRIGTRRSKPVNYVGWQFRPRRHGYPNELGGLRGQRCGRCCRPTPCMFSDFRIIATGLPIYNFPILARCIADLAC